MAWCCSIKWTIIITDGILAFTKDRCIHRAMRKMHFETNDESMRKFQLNQNAPSVWETLSGNRRGFLLESVRGWLIQQTLYLTISSARGCKKSPGNFLMSSNSSGARFTAASSQRAPSEPKFKFIQHRESSALVLLYICSAACCNRRIILNGTAAH